MEVEPVSETKNPARYDKIFSDVWQWGIKREMYKFDEDGKHSYY